MDFMKEKHLSQCLGIFNDNTQNTIFKPLCESEFDKLFLSKSYFSNGVVCENDNGVVGFAFGTILGDVGYISYVGVNEKYRRKGIGKKLVLELEKKLRLKNVKRFDCMFYNPCQLEWIIPQNYPHCHPGVPGVHMKSDAYPFFKTMGYEDYAIQYAYYMPLSSFEEGNNVAERKARLKSDGIEICYFDPDKHFGFSELFDNINNEGWRKSVMSRLDEPIVVAVLNDKVIGYTGPLALAEDKRGMFCGVGVHTDYRSCGVGKAIFSTLCRGLKEMGGEYMSLFTGSNNLARFMYESIGFKKVADFSCMRKIL